MKRSTPLLATVLTAVALAVCCGPVTPALGAANPVIQDCFTHGKLTKTYPKPELQHALSVMSTYVKQYSSCQTDIENALQNAGTVKANGTGGGGGSSISTALIIVIVVVVLAIVAFGGLLIRRRRGLGGGSGSR
jgi:hypothetical protein